MSKRKQLTNTSLMDACLHGHVGFLEATWKIRSDFLHKICMYIGMYRHVGMYIGRCSYYACI